MGADRDLGGRFRLWVHCPDLLESQLTEYFSQYGIVTDFYCPRDRHNGTRKNFGFATFETEEGLRRTLAAGAEHLISGKTVRVNLAGPRPELPLLYMDPSQTQPILLPQTTGGSLGEPSPLRGQSSLPGQASLPGQSSLQSSALPSSRGSGPRIYVGGIPTAVSETMIRQHFSQWGQVTDCYFPRDKYLNRRKNFCFVTFATQQAAEKAAAQSDREINGYRIESISVTHDRHTHYQRQAVTPSQSQIPSYNSAPTPGVRDGSATGGMRWMGCARGAHNGGGIADSGLVTSVSALTNTMAGVDLTGMSPFRNAHYTPSVPVQHGIYSQMPGVQNVYMDEVGQGNVTEYNAMDVMFGNELPHMGLMGHATSPFMDPGLDYTLGYSQGQHAGAYGLPVGDANRLEANTFGKAMSLQSRPMAYHQSSGSLGTSPGSLAPTAITTSAYHPSAARSSAVSGV
ncbi:g6690 [Coccomyxa viridis]|uniref:G6690 protein n=1 Tax=Coccomyxa viridis TaxID=1274662 RepID=A0ABP1FVY7_9CHLO